MCAVSKVLCFTLSFNLFELNLVMVYSSFSKAQIRRFNNWKMMNVAGDRKFSQWRGSVIDSIVGAFLTQNASDNASR